MSSNATTTKPTTSSTNIQPKDRSISQSVKAAGFRDLNHMMHSYGLKRENQEDFEEARAILDGFNQLDQEDLETSQGKTKSPTNIQPKDRSISQSVKAAGFKDLNNMMQSYGLKRHNEDDVQVAKAILGGFNQRDQEDWEASQRKLENEEGNSSC